MATTFTRERRRNISRGVKRAWANRTKRANIEEGIAEYWASPRRTFKHRQAMARGMRRWWRLNG